MTTFKKTPDSIPAFLYGTAWKEEKTKELTTKAIKNGFRGIDTANQRKHYFEAAVGEALTTAYEQGLVQRKDLFLQTKFTYQNGQDHRLPYDASASLTEQVNQSFASSLDHLKTDFVDSYVLHGPELYLGRLTDGDREVWQAMEELQKQGKTRFLGVSNVNLTQIQSLWETATIKPKFVQNRCFASTVWDKEIRDFCLENEIIYQGFSLLTANKTEITSRPIVALAEKYQKTIPQLIFRFSLQVGMLPLTGTSDATHMKEDLEVWNFEMNEEELSLIENICTS